MEGTAGAGGTARVAGTAGVARTAGVAGPVEEPGTARVAGTAGVARMAGVARLMPLEPGRTCTARSFMRSRARSLGPRVRGLRSAGAATALVPMASSDAMATFVMLFVVRFPLVMAWVPAGCGRAPNTARGVPAPKKLFCVKEMAHRVGDWTAILRRRAPTQIRGFTPPGAWQRRGTATLRNCVAFAFREGPLARLPIPPCAKSW